MSDKYTVYDKYEGKLCALQLRVPYVGVTHPAQFAHDGGNYVASPLLRGFVNVEKDEVRVKLVLNTTDPDPEKQRNKVRIELDPDDVLYISVTEEPSLITP